MGNKSLTRFRFFTLRIALLFIASCFTSHGFYQPEPDRRPFQTSVLNRYGSFFQNKPVDDYLTIMFRERNFPHWMNTTGAEKLDNLPITNLSKVVMTNHLFSLDLNFKDTVLSSDERLGLVQLLCVQANLERSQVSAALSTNIKLSGTFDGSGSIMNGSTPFNGDGNWTVTMTLVCRLSTYFNYVNASHVKMDTGGESPKYFRFSCGKGEDQEEVNIYSNTNRTRTCGSFGHLNYNRMAQFEGILKTIDNQDEDTENLGGIKKHITMELGRHIQLYGGHEEVLRTKLGPLIHKYLAQLVEEKSMLSMLNFNTIEYYKQKMQSGGSDGTMVVVGF